MTSVKTSAPGFGAANPTHAAGVLAPEWEYELPSGEQQGTASFDDSFKALDALVVRSLRHDWQSERPLPRLGIARSAGGRATDVDDRKGQPYADA